MSERTPGTSPEALALLEAQYWNHPTVVALVAEVRRLREEVDRQAAELVKTRGLEVQLAGDAIFLRSPSGRLTELPKNALKAIVTSQLCAAERDAARYLGELAERNLEVQRLAAELAEARGQLSDFPEVP